MFRVEAFDRRATGIELPPETMPSSDIGRTQMLPEFKPQSEADKPKEMFEKERL